jgi:MFS family permease
MIGGSILALMPLVARDLLHGSARLYGILLSAFGMGAVFGALLTPRVRERVGSETAVRGCAFAMGIGIALMAVSGDPVATALALILAGSGWTMAWTLFNVGVQMAAPNWVSGRSVAAYSAASLGGFAIGSWGWGHLTDIVGVRSALLVSAGMMLCSPLLGLRLRMPPVDARHTETVDIEEPDVRLAVAGESGPISIEVEYRIAEENVDALQQGMQELRISRQRNGAYGWAIARDLADPERWIERFQCPTWHEYLRLRNRSTPADRTLQERVLALHIGPGKVQVRRMIDCPPNGAKA